MTAIRREAQHLPPIYQGESRSVLITVTDEDTGERVDLTTATEIEFQVKAKIGDADASGDIAKTLTGGGIALRTQSGATLGQALVSLVPVDTSTKTAATYFYDVVVTWSDGSRSVVVIPSHFPIRAVVNQV